MGSPGGKHSQAVQTFMNALWAGVAALARLAIWCGGAMLFAAAGLVTAEVVLRKGLGLVFGSSFVFSGSDEISAYLFAVGTSWSMAYVLVSRGHVRIDALYGRLPPRVRALLDIFALLVLGLFVAALLERAWDIAFTSYIEQLRSNTPLRLPLAWAQLPWFAGIALFFVALVLAVLRSVAALLRGDYAAVAEIAGAATQDEEIASELKGLGLQSGKATRGR
jgi:TRAP-type C4-dicarboxylate transport system permease small subunit